MNIKAAEMERIFGMSQNGIRLYEKHGILRPARKAGSSYRLYGPEEMQTMGCGVQLRRYGFTMQEAGALLGGADEETQLRALEARSDALEQEIEQLMRVRKSLRTQVRRIRRSMQLLDSCVLEEKPAMYFLATLRGDRPAGAHMGETLRQWVDRYTPHLSSAILMDGPYLTREDYDEPILLGVAVDAEIALELGLLASDLVVYLPPKPCIVTALHYPQGLAPALERVRRYARENGLSLHAGAFIRQVQCVRSGDQAVQTGLLYAPLAGDERKFGGMK